MARNGHEVVGVGGAVEGAGGGGGPTLCGGRDARAFSCLRVRLVCKREVASRVAWRGLAARNAARLGVCREQLAPDLGR